MSNKTTKPKYTVLKLSVNIPVAVKMDEARKLTPEKAPENLKHIAFEDRVLKNAFTLLGNDQDLAWKEVQKELDARMIFPDSYDVIADTFNLEELWGSFKVSIVVHPEDRDKWVDTAQIKRVAN